MTITTQRLVLRPLQADDAPVIRQLWTERDPRVPPHRRLDALGHPTIDEVRAQVLQRRGPLGLLAAQDRQTGDVLGYCGLVDSENGRPLEPEIAFEFLRRGWGRGLATEAGQAVVQWAAEQGIDRLWATVWDWNLASRRVLDKLGFTTTERTRVDPERGTTLYLTRGLDLPR